MSMLRNLAAASILALAGSAFTGNAHASPAGGARVTPPEMVTGGGATLVRHWRRRCWPVYRWVWTHWGWRYRYVGTRCAPRPRRHWRYYD